MLSAAALRLVARELKELADKPEDGIRVASNGDNLAEVIADYDGPAGTPYEGGSFRLRLDLGPDFPSAPPKGTFLTKVFHPNVSTAGEVCVNVLKKDWQPDLGLRHVLVVVRCLLIEPFAESALNEEAGRLLLEDYSEFARRARLVTSIHAAGGRAGSGAAATAAAGPLTAAGGANAVNGAGGVGEGEGGGGGGGGALLPGGAAPAPPAAAAAAAAAAKAAKAAAVKKRSLKRL